MIFNNGGQTKSHKKISTLAESTATTQLKYLIFNQNNNLEPLIVSANQSLIPTLHPSNWTNLQLIPIEEEILTLITII